MECPVQKLAGRSDEWQPYHVFLLPGLFAYQHDFRIGWAFPEYGLCSVAVQRTGGAFSRVFLEGLDCFDVCGLGTTASDVLK
jgi:hypothetical protein